MGGAERLGGRDAHCRILLQHLREEVARCSGCGVAPSPDQLEPLRDEAWVAHLVGGLVEVGAGAHGRHAVARADAERRRARRVRRAHHRRAARREHADIVEARLARLRVVAVDGERVGAKVARRPRECVCEGYCPSALTMRSGLPKSAVTLIETLSFPDGARKP